MVRNNILSSLKLRPLTQLTASVGDVVSFNKTIVPARTNSELAGSSGVLEFTVEVKPDADADPTSAARTAVDGLTTPGVLQTAAAAVEGYNAAADAVADASDQLSNVEALVSPLVENMKIFADLVTTFSKVCL